MVKGSTLKSRQEFIIEHYGKEAIERLRPFVDESTIRTLTGSILATKWFDFAINLDLDAAIATHLGEDTEAFYRSMGAFSATREGSTAYRALTSERDPDRLLRRASTLWTRFFTPGSMRYEEVGFQDVRLSISGFQSTRQHCWTNLGFFVAIIGLAGGIAATAVEESCTSTGAAACVYHLRWRKA